MRVIDKELDRIDNTLRKLHNRVINKSQLRDYINKYNLKLYWNGENSYVICETFGFLGLEFKKLFEINVVESDKVICIIYHKRLI